MDPRQEGIVGANYVVIPLMSCHSHIWFDTGLEPEGNGHHKEKDTLLTRLLKCLTGVVPGVGHE